MNDEIHKVGLVAVLNLATAGVGTALTHVHTILEVAVPLGQVLVSIITVWYIWTKIRKDKQK